MMSIIGDYQLCTACCLKVIRAVVVMSIDTTIPAIQIADKVLWLIVRFFLLATEMSIVTFGVAAGEFPCLIMAAGDEFGDIGHDSVGEGSLGCLQGCWRLTLLIYDDDDGALIGIVTLLIG